MPVNDEWKGKEGKVIDIESSLQASSSQQQPAA